jgi:hypothetical protein
MRIKTIIEVYSKMMKMDMILVLMKKTKLRGLKLITNGKKCTKRFYEYFSIFIAFNHHQSRKGSMLGFIYWTRECESGYSSKFDTSPSPLTTGT